ncbi:MAG: TonB-dependent siderophore receptor [Pseudomonadota bacterium]
MARHLVFSALALVGALASAQPVQQVTVTGRIINSPLQVGGFGDIPLAKSPFAASLLSESQLLDAGARNLSDLTKLDAAISDAYNAEGYWQSLTVRGFVIDNRFNYRRDGLPVNAETVLPLDNKSSLELLKGISGIQAGTSAPGGLVNLVVKRPTKNQHSAVIEWREPGSIGTALDLSQRFGKDESLGLRINAAYDALRPQVRNAEGHAYLLAIAGDWRLAPDTLLEAEAETSRQSQPSVPGFSLLGDRLPSAGKIDPRINLNNQPWSLPVVFEGDTASLRLQQRLGNDGRFVAHAMTQRLRTDDRVAFPYGKYDPLTWECNPCDRYAADGTFSYWDFRSENERRSSDALQLELQGQLATGTVSHRLSTGVLFTRFESRFQRQAFNLTGDGRIDGSAVVAPMPQLTDENTNRNERSTEFFVRDAMQLSAQWSLWTGLRHARLQRESVRTDGSRRTDYGQSLTTPWFALAFQATPRTLWYASWGQGMESDVAPNRSRYTNRGEALPALKSRQAELGLKFNGDAWQASAALFDIDRPQAEDIGACGADDSCTRLIDGSSRHRGLEALVSTRLGTRFGTWQLHASGMWLDAQRRGARDAAINGRRPVNVAERTLRLQAAHELAALAGLSLAGSVVHEGDRMAVPDNSVRIPSWTRLDLLARYQHQLGTARLTWRLGIDNATDKRAWKEAPYQFGHAYLFPMAPRTWRVALQAEI